MVVAEADEYSEAGATVQETEAARLCGAKLHLLEER